MAEGCRQTVAYAEESALVFGVIGGEETEVGFPAEDDFEYVFVSGGSLGEAKLLVFGAGNFEDARGKAETDSSQLASGVTGDTDNVRFQERDVDASGPFLIVISRHNATSRCPAPARSDPFCVVPDLTVFGMPSPLDKSP